MATLTALLHTDNDALRLGRALETLCPCDEILIIDHDSQDDTRRVAKEYGAKVVSASKEPANSGFIRNVSEGWILCLNPRESLSEGLSAALFEWKSSLVPDPATCFAVWQREETSAGWIQHPAPQTRLVPASWSHWNGHLPLAGASPVSLDGELLRFAFP